MSIDLQPLQDLIGIRRERLSRQAWDAIGPVDKRAKQPSPLALSFNGLQSLLDDLTDLLQVYLATVGLQSSAAIPAVGRLSQLIESICDKTYALDLPFSQLLRLLKGVRQTYLQSLVSERFGAEQQIQFSQLIHRFFDQVELTLGEIGSDPLRSQSGAAEKGPQIPIQTWFEYFLAEAPFGVSICQPDTLRFMWVNQAFCQLTHYSAEQLQTLTAMEITHPDDQFRQAALAQRGSQGLPDRFCLEKRYLTSRGQVVWANLQSMPLRDGAGNVQAILGIVEDITRRRAIETALQISEARLQAVLSNLPGVVYRCLPDADWTVEYVSRGIEMLTGYPPEDFVGSGQRSLASITHPEDRDRVRAAMQTAIATHQPFSVEYRCLTASGQVCWVADQGQGAWDADNNLLGIDGVMLDICDRKQAEERLTVLSEACEQSPASIIITDARGDIEYVNSKFQQITGYSLAEIKGQNPRILKSHLTPATVYDQLRTALTQGQAWYGEFQNRKKNGELFWEKAAISPIKDPNGRITHYVGVKEDITLHKETIELLAYQATFDHLTALPNRTLAFDRLRQALDQAEKNREYVALLLVDLDHFKTINETFGHDIGDALLVEAAQRLQACVSKGDTVARLGGDEFLVVLPGLTELTEVTRIAHAILASLEQPYQLDPEDSFLSASMGIVVFPNDGDASSTLLRNAEIALYSAKNTGRNTLKFFESGMNQAAQRRHLITSYLRRALDNHEFHLVYQPFVKLQQGQAVGAEALIRWTSPELGPVSPAEFIPVAEETGLITAIGEWVIQQACQEASQWPQPQGQPLWVAVNLSSRQFRTPQLLNTVKTALDAYHLPPSCLELEITERLLLDDLPATKDMMQQFRAMHIRLSIDDFGTGYSALSYLKKFPLNVLKIDRSFITDLPSDPDLIALVKAIISMAHELGLEVIAEGIETSEQLRLLQAYGCDYGQGHFFSAALSPQEFLAYLDPHEISEH